MDSARIETFGDLLRRYRREAGLTQEELAERARMSARGISDLERGTRQRPYRDTLSLLVVALGLSGERRAAFERAARTGPPSADFPPWRSLQSSTNNLPKQALPFIGRETAIADVRQRLAHSPVR